MVRRVVMHAMDEAVARRVSQALGRCAVTLSENHDDTYITLCGFDDVLIDLLPVLRELAPGFYVRTPTIGNG